MGNASIGLRAKLTVATFAVVVGFCLSEVGARVLYPAPPEPLRAPQLLYESHPDLGFFHAPSQAGYLDDGLATINEMGFRGELPSVPKPEGEIRVLAIGDSTTFGWGVDDVGTYCAQLEAMLAAAFPNRQMSVINAGVGAYDLDREAVLLKHFAPRLEPDVVLVGLYWNDLPYEKTTPDGRPLAARRSSPEAGSTEVSEAPDGAPRRFRIGNDPSRLNRILRRSRLLYVLRQAWLSAMATTETADNLVRWEMALLEGLESPAIDEAWQDVARSLADIRELGEAGGFAVGVLIIPIRAQVEGSYPRAAYQTRARALAEAEGFFAIDPLPRFMAAPDKASLFVPYDRMHLSAEGNALLAEAAFDALANGMEGRAFRPGRTWRIP